MTALLRSEDVTKSYFIGKREIPVLRGVDLELQEGEMLALLGQSGAGKSTILYLLGLLDQPTSGKIWFDGKDVTGLNNKQRAALRHREIGFVFQFYHLIPELSALQNVKLGQMMLKQPLAYFRERKAIHNRAVEILHGHRDRIPCREAHTGEQRLRPCRLDRAPRCETTQDDPESA